MLVVGGEEVLLRFQVDNPWWRDPVPFQQGLAPLRRRQLFDSFHALLTNLEIPRAPVLMGPRRVGKSVMLKQSIAALLTAGVPAKDILYASLDVPVYTGLGLEQLLRLWLGQEGLLERRTRYVFFDEIQYLKDWERHLKTLVDSFPWMRFVASGSAAAALRMKSQESGAGRFTAFYLPGLAFAEFLGFSGREDLNKACTRHQAKQQPLSSETIEALNGAFIDYIAYGGFPEPTMIPAIRDRSDVYIRNDIIDSVLLRDLPSLYGIDDVQELNRLFTALAYNTGREVNLDGLAQGSTISKNTLRRYLEYLEAAFLIVRLPRLDETGKRFKRETFFKVYLTVPSLRAALFGAMAETDERFGELVETAIVAQFVHTRLAPTLRYARWGKGEVDIVGIDPINDKIASVLEVKWTDRFTKRPDELKVLLEFAERTNPFSVDVTSRGLFVTTPIRGIDIEHSPASYWAWVIGRAGRDPEWSLNTPLTTENNGDPEP